MTPAEITAHFHHKIPISAQMGVEVREASSSHAVLFVPLGPNINHVHTAFGGSLYSAAALSCYALFQMISREAGGLSDEIVIQNGSIKYIAPITGDFLAKSRLVDPGDTERFIKSLQQHGKARLQLEADIYCGDLLGATFQGLYVFKSRA